MSKFKIKANEYFKKKLYKEAMDYYTHALNDYPDDLDIKIGILLSDLASENETEALILFELYENAKANQIESISSIIESLLVDNSDKLDIEELEVVNLESNIYEIQNGIDYRDFKNLVDDRESFKVALEDLLFSTKIIIHKKDDFIEFVTLLLNNGYTNVALNYLESALSLYPHEIFFQDALSQIEG